METQIVKLEHLGTKITPCYGGQNVIAEFHLTTICENIKNEYKIEGEIRGIATNDLHYNLISCEALTNNENTLIKEAIEDLLEW